MTITMSSVLTESSLHPHDCSNCCRMERELPGGFIH
jgi:hypothetical protein